MVGSHLDVAVRGMQESTVESQKSSLFPWDNAGVGSSAGFDFGVTFETPNVSSGIGGKVPPHSRSASRREGSVARSLAGSPVPFSFQDQGPLSDDFQFRGTTPESACSMRCLRAHQFLRKKILWPRWDRM